MLKRLENALAGDKIAKACWLGISDPVYVRSFCEAPVDAVVLDMQHGFFDEKEIIQAIVNVVASGKAPIVRIPVQEWGLVERVMDFGALGVIAPMINTVEDASRFAAATKYPPQGSRSYGPRHAATLYGISVPDYLADINLYSKALAMIETKEAYENLDGILAVEGIDGVLMGPGDFSISMTGNIVPDAYGKGSIAEIEVVARKARAAGKIAACFTGSVEHANLAHSLGYNLISVGFDPSYIQAAIHAHFDGLGF